MASRRQVKANRRNAQRSTGPRTAEGQAAAAANALQHGLTARQLILYDEAEGDFAAVTARRHAAWAPEDAVEEQLVERMILCAWRLRRAARIEADFLNHWGTSTLWDGNRLCAGFEEAPQPMMVIARYESGLERAFHRAGLMLERRQAQRRGEPVPPPLVVQVEGLDEPAAASVSATTADAPAAPETEFCETKPILLRT